MTPTAWAVRHQADKPGPRPVYWTKAEAVAHAAQFRPGVARVVPLGEIAAEHPQQPAPDLAATLAAVHAGILRGDDDRDLLALCERAWKPNVSGNRLAPTQEQR